MTDRAAPGAQGSTVRNMEYGEMGGAPAPFLLPFGEQTLSAQRWSGLDNPKDTANNPENGPFAYDMSYPSQTEIEFNPGEGFVSGWFATDSPKRVDLDGYQSEVVTVVVGWDPDAVYSSDVHSSRESADSVFTELESKVDKTKPYIPIWRGEVIPRDDGGLALENDITDLRPIGRPIETLPAENETSDYGSDTKGPGVNLFRGRPTTFTGAVNTGPHETPVNAERTVHAFAPVDADAEPGTEVQYTDLDVAGSSAGRYQYTHGVSGAYGSRYNAALGRLSRINANVSWEYDTFENVTQWTELDDGTNNAVSLTDSFPRKMEVATAGEDDGNYITTLGGPVISVESLGKVRITFKGVESSIGGTDLPSGKEAVGVTTITTPMDPANSSYGYMFERNAGGTRVRTVTDGSGHNQSGSVDANFDTSTDITLEYDGMVVDLFADGEYVTNREYEQSEAFRPFIAKEDSETTAETFSAEQLIVEALE